MVKKVTILFLFIYMAIVFGHSLASIGHHVLHMTSEIVALHDHGHDHDVTDHGEIFKAEKQTSDYKTAHFNMLSLVFFFQLTTHLLQNQKSFTLDPQTTYDQSFESINQSPPTPPPIS